MIAQNKLLLYIYIGLSFFFKLCRTLFTTWQVYDLMVMIGFGISVLMNIKFLSRYYLTFVLGRYDTR